MSRILFARHNYAKAPQYRLLTTIEQHADTTRVYKRATTAAAEPYLQQLLNNQQLVADFVGLRADVVQGQQEDDGRISYPFIALPSLQKLICEDLLRDDYASAYSRLHDWIGWIQALPAVEADPRDGATLASIYGDSLPIGVVPCLLPGLIDLTTENVLWDEQQKRYVLIDHDIVLSDPVPIDIIIFRLLFFLCHNFRYLLQSAAERHPLRQFGYKGFLIPQEWDVTSWIDSSELRRLFRGEERFQSYFAGAPIYIDIDEEIITIAERQSPNVAVQLAQRDARILAGFAKYDQDSQTYQRWLAERDAVIDELRGEIVHKDTDIATLQSWVAERDEQIRKNTADIEQFQSWLAEHESQLTEQIRKSTEDTATFKNWLAERDAIIAAKEQQIAAVYDQRQQQEAVIATLRERLQNAEQDVATLHSWVADRDAQILQLFEQTARTEGELSAIKQSFGWKLLHPFWKLRQRVLPSNGVVSRNIRRTRTVVRVLRRDGPGGLVRYGEGWVRHRIGRPPRQHVLNAPAASHPSSEDASDPDHYAQWIAINEPDAVELQRQRIDTHLMVDQPLISVLTPVYNPPPVVLEAMIESVLAQTYGNWELLLVNGSPDNGDVRAILDRAAARDRRVRVLHLEANRGIVGNTNAGLAEVGGTFVAFLDHDDTLAPFALFEVARLLNERPESDLIYSDSDLLSLDGSRRFQPLFKPDWSPAIMLSANYATHLCVIRTSLLQEVGGLAEGTDGAQDWDLILRVSERTEQVVHLPKILYHWRESPVSTAMDISRKPYALQAQFGAVKSHLARQGLQAEVFLDPTGYIRASWPLSGQSLVSIIIPSRNLALLQRCINSIQLHTSYRQFEIIVIDTTPDGAISSHYGTQASVRVVQYTAPFNYSAVNNLAAEQATGNLLLFLNDDTEAIEAGWLAELVRWAERDQIGVVGAKLLREDGHIQHAGVVVGLGGFADHPFAGGPEGQHTIYGCTEWYRNYSAVTGACLMIRRELFEQVGGFDEQLALCGNDVELCLRVGRLGYQVWYTPFARLRHLESVTRGTTIPREDFLHSYLHYRPLLAKGDPFYNPNLSGWSTQPQLRQRGEDTPLVFAERYLTQLGLDIPSESDQIAEQGTVLG